MSRVFVSYSHENKSIAKRIVRFLRAYGVNAWIDEREIRLGSRLDDAICAAIRDSDALVVVATQAAAGSQWVEREITFAGELSPAIPVFPVYVDQTVKAHPFFAPHLGIEVRDQYQFVDVLTRLAEAFVGSPLPEPDPEQLKAGLEELARENPDIALLAESCLQGRGLFSEHVKLVSEVPFHELDDALNILSQLENCELTPHATTRIFTHSGAGSAPLSRYIAAGHNDILISVVGVPLDPAMFDVAIRLLAIPNPPNDQALASFLWKNSELLGAKYRNTIVRLVSHPNRGPAGFGADAAAAAFDIFPEDDDLVILWSRWIREGLFDEQNTQAFAYWCARGLEAGSGGWKRVFDSFVDHVRGLARKKSKQSVYQAIDHLRLAADNNNPRLQEIIRECRAAIGAAEWDDWEDRDEMSIYVSEMTNEAETGKRRWGTASLRAEEQWQNRVNARRAIAERDDSAARE